ncbi:MAG: phospholipid scramblase-related protein [bacterium]
MITAQKCPKCDFISDTEFDDCPKCGVIVSKFLEREKERKEFEESGIGEENLPQANLNEAPSLMIKQQKEWGEILTGFETKNKYIIMDNFGNQMFQAVEEGGSILTIITRNVLRALRPFTIHIFSPEGMNVFLLKRPFRFYFHELQVYKSDGALLGRVQRRFSMLRRIYTVFDRHGREICELFGPILHPWTFFIKKGDKELGKITKKWSGLLKESMTDADNFGITFPQGIGVDKKAVLLGAVFLIDFVHFESKGN